ncbi:gdsl lipase acylhydrolase family protein [Ophiostoma piceae UAMH 11346]|uniref:Gdsl lipase acylhydrolase family protein n=1 Tax=Ophiostoma piceae (strain UAMH 11346) TaxID=1262450 RepID=S3CLA2_OPHP1|nr:gdsl lipase acylhydrolase family protein [Ophiostoma piceae UAMH 11346]
MAKPYPQVVLFGDSLFQGATETQDGFSLQGALSAYGIRRFDIINRGLSGYNTSQALRVLPSVFPLPKASDDAYVPKIAYLVVLLGANDAALPATVDNQHIPLAEYKANLKSIITHPNILAHKPEKIIVVTPPPVDSIRLAEYESLVSGQQQPVSRLARVSAEYSKAAREVGESVPGVQVVDLHKSLTDLAVARTPGYDPKSGIPLGDKESKRGYLANLLTDGLHLSGEGYRVLWEELKPHLAPPSTDDESGGWAYPSWRLAPLYNAAAAKEK